MRGARPLFAIDRAPGHLAPHTSVGRPLCVLTRRVRVLRDTIGLLARCTRDPHAISHNISKIGPVSARMRADISCAGHVLRTRPASMLSP